MVICRDCKQEMTNSETKTCTRSHLRVLLVEDGKEWEGKPVKRNSEYFDKNERCHDCGIENKKGNYHHWGCDMERCFICEEQMITCQHFQTVVEKD